MDSYDAIEFAIKYAKESGKEFKHIIIDNCEKLTRGEINFIKALYKEDKGSNAILIINSEEVFSENQWFVKGRRLKEMWGEKYRLYSFKSVFKATIEPQTTLENYEYINLKHKGIINFNIDTASNEKEIFLGDKDVIKEDELKAVPIYTEIAAGAPMEMTDYIQGEFNLPIPWLEKGKETFILPVKGDSMMDKNILEGDLVVIKKQSTAQNNEIVAATIDGEATLKMLNLNDNEPKLIPANKKYSPIYLKHRDACIIGVAIGVIKRKA